MKKWQILRDEVLSAVSDHERSCADSDKLFINGCTLHSSLRSLLGLLEKDFIAGDGLHGIVGQD